MEQLIYNELEVRGNLCYPCASCIQSKRIVRDPEPLIDLGLWKGLKDQEDHMQHESDTASLRSLRSALDVTRKYMATSASSDALTSTAV